MNGAVEHYKACREAGIKPILGLEAYLVDDRRAAQAPASGRAQPPDPAGGQRRGLSQPGQAHARPATWRASPAARRTSTWSCSTATPRASSRSPAVSSRASASAWSRAAPPTPGLTSTSCSGSSAPTTSTSRSRSTASPSRTKANEGIVRVARELGRPLVATADVHYLRREDYDNHAALLCVQTKSTLEQPKLTLRHQRVLPQEPRGDGARRSPRGPRRCPTTLEIAERCEVEIELGKLLLPRFPTPEGEEPGEMLRRLANEGLRRRYGDPAPADGARAARVRARRDRARWASSPTS